MTLFECVLPALVLVLLLLFFVSINAKPNKHTIIHSNIALEPLKLFYTLLAIKCCCITMFWCVPGVLSCKNNKMKNSIRNICTRMYALARARTHIHEHKNTDFHLGRLLNWVKIYRQSVEYAHDDARGKRERASERLDAMKWSVVKHRQQTGNKPIAIMNKRLLMQIYHYDDYVSQTHTYTHTRTQLFVYSSSME